MGGFSRESWLLLGFGRRLSSLVSSGDSGNCHSFLEAIRDRIDGCIYGVLVLNFSVSRGVGTIRAPSGYGAQNDQCHWRRHGDLCRSGRRLVVCFPRTRGHCSRCLA